MQRCFVDAANTGRLYINYPMIESYQHLRQLPDDDFAERKIPVSLQPGKEYKALVEQETILGSKVDFPHRIDDMLEKHFKVSDMEKRIKCCNEILGISSVSNMESVIENALREVVAEHILPTVKYQLVDWVTKQGYAQTNQGKADGWQISSNE